MHPRLLGGRKRLTVELLFVMVKYPDSGYVQAQHLVQTGADIAAKDKRQFTTLHFAAAHGHLDVVTFLWSKGAELDWETPG